MIALYALIGVVVAVLLRKRTLRRRKLVESPLAGFDTGARSPWRVPGRRWHRPHRGF